MNLLKSILHNIGVLIVGFVFASIGRGFDLLLKIPTFRSPFIAAGALLIIGFIIRVWATFYFYEQGMAVIRLEPQKRLFTSGPYRFSRNPLYLGGNVFIFLGAVLFLGSPSGVALTAIAIAATDVMIRREEKQLAQKFGQEWTSYKSRVRRWI
ncbi:MAG: isoprenylcysteine carboxylmethyltransferase family protein [Terracidiphilus sp.]